MSGPYERFAVSHVEDGVSNKALDDSYRLRYEIYCLEEKFLPAQDYPDHSEIDNYDALSEHVFVHETIMNKVAGCARLVKYSKSYGLPTADHFPELYNKLSGVPLTEMYEVSRLCIAPFFRKRLVPKDGLYGVESYLEENIAPNPNGLPEQRKYPIVLLLMLREMYRLTMKMGGNFWIASMEPGLIRYLSGCGMECVRLAEDYIEFYGKVIPCLFDLRKAIVRMSEKRPDIYDFFIYDIKL